MVKRLFGFAKRNFVPFLKSVSLICAGGYGYACFRAMSNRREFEKILKEGDTTRPSNENFGLNFGATADRLVKSSVKQLKDELDSGDIFYADFDYRQFLTATDILEGFFRAEIMKEEEKVKGVGFRIDEDNYLIAYKLFNKIHSKDYSDFLRLPYFSEISCTKVNLPKDVQKDPSRFIGYAERITRYRKEREYNEFFSLIKKSGFSLGKKIVIRAYPNKFIRENSNN